MKPGRVLILSAVLMTVFWSACSTTFITRKPWRTYDKMPFDSQKWREGDEIERGRMLSDMRVKIVGKTADQVIEILGEPDETFRQDGAESWLYNTEHPGRKTYYQTGVEFDENGKARISIFTRDRILRRDQK